MVSTRPGEFEIFRNNRINLFTFGGVPSPSGLFIGSFGLGRFPDGNFYQFDSNSNLVGYTPGEVGPGSAFFALGGDGPDFFDEVDQLQSPLDRGVFTGQFNYDLTNNVRFSSDFLFSRVQRGRVEQPGRLPDLRLRWHQRRAGV